MGMLTASMFWFLPSELQAALKKYQTEQRNKGDALDKCQAELKKLRKKSQGSKNPQKYSDKELQVGWPGHAPGCRQGSGVWARGQGGLLAPLPWWLGFHLLKQIPRSAMVSTVGICWRTGLRLGEIQDRDATRLRLSPRRLWVWAGCWPSLVLGSSVIWSWTWQPLLSLLGLLSGCFPGFSPSSSLCLLGLEPCGVKPTHSP